LESDSECIEQITMDDYRKGSSSLSYYNILGVSSDSSIDEIRRAYRKLAMVSYYYNDLQ
jgi:preprotein translocase subunit Sec63